MDTPREEDAVARQHVDAVHKAEAFLTASRPDMAEPILQRALAERPEDPWLLYQLARTELLLERPSDAEHTTRRCLAAVPTFVPAYSLLGSLLMNDGHNREAEATFLEGLRIDPEEDALYQAYAILMRRTGHFDKAEKLLHKALALNPEEERYHATLAALLAERRKGAAAHAHGKRSVELDPTSDVSHAALGISYLMAGHPFLARRHLREAVRLDPEDEGGQAAFLTADRCCRWIYLPMYHWSLLLDRLPGKQFLVWGLFIAIIMVLPGTGLSRDVTSAITWTYVAFMLYTWVADPLARIWIKLVPPT